jgi:Xaa-Pro aminopeptidase
MPVTHPVPGLTVDGCHARQQRIRDALKKQGLQAALLTWPGHVMFATNFWHRQIFFRAALVLADGPTILATPLPPDEPAHVDHVVEFESNRMATLVAEQARNAVKALQPWLTGLTKIGVDDLPRTDLLGSAQVSDFWPAMYQARRTKDADELAMMRCAISGADAALDYAIEKIHAAAPDVTELELVSRMNARASEAVGEAIGELGNDFRCGALGGAPRNLKPPVGDLYILDIGVSVRGYNCDFCRTFAVGNKPSSIQREAHARCMEVHDWVQANARPGVTSEVLYSKAKAMLDGHKGWSFPHHLGHGVGLFPHELPRINGHAENVRDALQAGDIISIEPGLYHADLRGGLRLEHNYLVKHDGLEILTPFPMAL